MSEQNPHKYDPKMIPIEVIPERMPFCCVVKLKSHCAMGKTKLIPRVSNDAQVMTMPEMKTNT